MDTRAGKAGTGEISMTIPTLREDLARLKRKGDVSGQTEHVPDLGPMSFARWNAAGGYRFCSCWKWHWEDNPVSENEGAKA